MFFLPSLLRRGARGAHFFRKPPAFHRPLFMPPFAGDIGARAGSLKWTAQIPRKAYRWSLGCGSKCCDGVSNVEAGLREQIFIMPPPRQKRLEQLRTGRIGSRQQLAGGVPWGCSGGAQRSYGDHPHPIRLRFHGKPLF